MVVDGFSGKVHTPRTVSKESGKWSSPLSHVAPVSYLKGDYKKVEQEYEIILREKWEPQRVFEWTKEKYLKATHMAKTASEFDLWELKQWHDKFKTTIFGTVRLERQEFYIHKAGQLWPPISEDVLWAFSAFHNALASPVRTIVSTCERVTNLGSLESSERTGMGDSFGKDTPLPSTCRGSSKIFDRH